LAPALSAARSSAINIQKVDPMTLLSLPERTRVPVAVRRRERAGSYDLARLTRYRGGTYSHTVDTIAFTDGATARTDLIRLNPNVEAYSLDFGGFAPTRPSHYRAANWSAVTNLRARAHEPEVDWILRNSFPTVGTAELSRRLRTAGHPMGSANVAEHEAIAATQAAIWFFTNDLYLDNRPLNVPIATRRDVTGITFEFGGVPQLGGYTVDVTSPGTASLVLQKSTDGVVWRDVAASGLNVAAPGRYRKVLGLGSTMSHHRPGQRGLGYRYYRLVVVSDGDRGIEVGDVEFWLEGSSHYRNADRVVHLYDYLLAGARSARHRAVAPELSAAHAGVEDGLIGPFRLHANQTAALTVSNGTMLDADGNEVHACEPGGEFYVRPNPGIQSATVTATVPARADGFGGRVITGVARDDVNSRLTPVALAVPAPLVVDFHLQWAPQAEADLDESRLHAASG
jgi:TQXA domain-containing protein